MSSRRIDVHFHLIRPSTARRSTKPAAVPPSASIRTGRRALCSTSWTRTASRSRSLRRAAWRRFLVTSERAVLARRCNDYAAELVARWPKRFGAFAAVPMWSIEGAVDEIAYRRTCSGSTASRCSRATAKIPRRSRRPRAGDAQRARRGVFVHPGLHPPARARPAVARLHDGVPVRHHAGGVNLVFSGAVERFPRVDSSCPMRAGWCPISPGGCRCRRYRHAAAAALARRGLRWAPAFLVRQRARAG